jgi:hypothetical protein
LISLKSAYPEKNILSRDRITIGQELDIYLPEDRIAIEYGAWHWHENKLKEDLDKMRTCKEHGIEANESKLMRQISSLLEMSANASDEDFQAMVYRTNTNREYFNYTHNLRLSPWAYLVYVAGRDVLL